MCDYLLLKLLGDDFGARYAQLEDLLSQEPSTHCKTAAIYLLMHHALGRIDQAALLASGIGQFRDRTPTRKSPSSPPAFTIGGGGVETAISSKHKGPANIITKELNFLKQQANDVDFVKERLCGNPATSDPTSIDEMNRIASCLECYLPLAVMNSFEFRPDTNDDDSSSNSNIVCDVYLPAIRRLARACKAYPAMTGKCKGVLTYFLISLSSAGMVSRRELEQLVDDVVGVSDSKDSEPKPLLSAPPKLTVSKQSANLLAQITSNLVRPVKRASWPTIEPFTPAAAIVKTNQPDNNNNEILARKLASKPATACSFCPPPTATTTTRLQTARFSQFNPPAHISNWRHQPRWNNHLANNIGVNNYHFRIPQPQPQPQQQHPQNIRNYFPWGNGPSTFTDISSGMRDVPKWLKFLRLHKYNSLFASLTYEEMLNVDEAFLEQRSVTKGARDKILQNIQRIKQRPQLLKTIIQVLQVDDSQWYDAINNLFLISVTPIPSYLQSNEDQQVPGLFVQAIGEAVNALRKHGIEPDANIGNLSRDRSQMVNMVDRFLRHEAFTNEHKDTLCGLRKELCSLSFSYAQLVTSTASPSTQTRIRAFLRDEHMLYGQPLKQRTHSSSDRNSHFFHGGAANPRWLQPEQRSLLAHRHSEGTLMHIGQPENGLEPLGSHTLLHRCRSYYGYHEKIPPFHRPMYSPAGASLTSSSYDYYNRPAYVTLNTPQIVVDAPPQMSVPPPPPPPEPPIPLKPTTSITSQRGDLPVIEETCSTANSSQPSSINSPADSKPSTPVSNHSTTTMTKNTTA